MNRLVDGLKQSALTTITALAFLVGVVLLAAATTALFAILIEICHLVAKHVR